MSSSIDRRIVEMRFDNKQFEKGIQTSLESLTSLKKNLQFDNVSNGIEETTKSVKTLAHQFTLLGRIGLKVKDAFADLIVNRGKQLVKSLSIDQVSAGWTKYGQKTASVQTIMNATGKTIDEVNGYLDKLMWFSDETSYNFTEMTSALGTMTSSGGDIEKLIPMIEGMAAATAFAGKGASEFSRVIYNLNQSYGQGYLSYLDWKSVEGANVSSAQLKQTLIDTAVALGTLKKDAKGVVTTAKRTVVTVDNMGSTLNEKWVTSEVMEQAFGKFGAVFQEAYELVESGQFDTAAEAIASLAGKYDDVYYNAAKAAQEAKTFSEAIDSTKDAVSSGWMKTFEIIFGNYEEAKETWTNLANFLWEAFASGGESRNDLLEEWKELGGRDDLIGGVGNSLRAVLNIVTALKGGIAEIFPSPDATQLVSWTQKVKELGDMLLRLSGEEYSETEVEIPVSVNTDPEELKRTLKRDMAGDDVKALQERLTSLGYSISDFELSRGYFGVATRDAVKQFQKDLGLTVDGIYNQDVHEVLWEKLFPPTESSRVEKTVERVSVFSSVLERTKRVIRGVAAAADILWKGIKFVGTVVVSVLKVLTPLADALLTILAALGDCFVALDKGLGISDLFASMLATVIGRLEPVTRWIQKASDALLEFFGLGKKENGTNESLTTFAKLCGSMKGKLKDWGVWDALTKAWDRLREAAGKLGDAFKQLWPSIKASWQNLKTAIGEKLPAFSEKAKTGAANLWSKSIRAIGVGLSKAIDFLTSIVQKLLAIRTKISEFAQTAWEFLTGLWAKLKASERFGSAAAKISEFFRSIWKSVSEFFVGGDAAEEKLSIFSKIAATLKQGWEKVSSVVTWVCDGIDTLWKKVGGFDGIIGKGWGLTSLFGGIASVKLIRSLTSVVKAFAGIAPGATSLLTTIGTAIRSFFTNAESVFSSIKGYLESRSLESKAKRTDAIAHAVKSFAIALLAIVGAIYILGKMDPDELKQGAITILGIAAALAILQVGCRLLTKNCPDQTQFRGILPLTLAVLTLAVVMKLVNKLSHTDYLKGLARVSGMILALRLIMVGFEKLQSTNVSIKGMLSLSFALIALLSVIMLVNKLSHTDYLKGLARVSGMILALRLFIAGFKKLDSPNVSIKGLIRLSISLLALVGVIKIISGMEAGKYWTSLLRLSGLMLALMLFARSLSKLDAKRFGGKAAGLIVIALAIHMFARAMRYIGKLDTRTYVLGLGGLTTILLALKGLLKAVAQINLKQVAGVLVMCVGVAALMGLFTLALRKVEDVDDRKIKWFGLGITGMLAALALIMRQSSKLTFAGIAKSILSIVAIAAAIGLVIAAFAGLRKIPGFQEFMNGGAESIGAIVGSFLGGMSKAQIEVFNNLATDLDEDSLDRALSLANALSDFEKKLPTTGTGNILSLLQKSPLGQFSGDMSTFGTKFTEFARALNQITVEEYEDLSGKATKAIEIATALATFTSTYVPEASDKSLSSGIWTWMNGSDLQIFSEGMGTFGEKFNNFAAALDGIENTTYNNLSGKAATAIEIASAFATFVNNDVTAPAKVNLGWLGADYISATESFSRDMSTFGTCFSNFAAALDGIENTTYNNLSGKAATAIEIASAFATFVNNDIKTPSAVEVGWIGMVTKTATDVFTDDMADFAKAFNTFVKKISPITTEELDGLSAKTENAIDIATALANFMSAEIPEVTMVGTGILGLNYKSINEVFNEDMEDFAGAFNGFATILSKIENPPSTDQTNTAIACAQLVADFFNDIGGMEGIESKGAVATWWSGDTNLNTVLEGIVTLATNVVTASEALSGISDLPTAKENLEFAFSVLNSMADITVLLSGMAANFQYMTGDQINNSWWLITDLLTKAVDTIPSLATAVKDFYDQTKDLDTTRVTNVMQALTDMFASMQLLDQDKWKDYLNTEKWLENLDVKAFESTIDDFTTAANRTIDDLYSTLGYYAPLISENVDGITASIGNLQSGFSAAGLDFASSLSNGYGWNSDTSTFTKSTQEQLSAVTAFKSKFRVAGQDFAIGLAKGLDDRKYHVIKAANVLAQSVLDEIREVFDEHSPSKEANEIGRYFDKGLAGGLKEGSSDTTRAAKDMALDALHGVQDTLLALSNLIADGIDVDPVIRPVVDLSNVTAGAQAIGGMLGGSQTVSVDTSTRLSSNAARAAAASAIARQTAGTQTQSSAVQSAGDQVNVTGNTFVIRDDQDIYSLASEIATLLYRQQRSAGAH